MAATPEAKVKKAVRALLDELGIYHFMPPANGFGRAGIPDIILCGKGKFGAIECKAGNNKPTELQTRELDRIEKTGGFVFVARETNLTDLKEYLQIWLK